MMLQSHLRHIKAKVTDCVACKRETKFACKREEKWLSGQMNLTIDTCPGAGTGTLTKAKFVAGS